MQSISDFKKTTFLKGSKQIAEINFSLVNEVKINEFYIQIFMVNI